MKLIHLTDPHLTADGALYGIDVDARLHDAVASINRDHGDAEIAMITGDIAHWGEPGAYLRAKDALGNLVMPWYPLIGNHDVRAAFLSGFPDVPHTSANQVFFRLDVSAGHFFVLDTVIEGVHFGEIDSAQLEWLDQELSSVDGNAFLFMHHHPMVSEIVSLDRIRLQNADALAEILGRHPGKVRHLFFGHMHRTFHGSWRGLPFSTVKSTAHQVYPSFTDPSDLVASREHPGYGVVTITEDTVGIHDISYLEDEKKFIYDRDDGKISA